MLYEIIQEVGGVFFFFALVFMLVAVNNFIKKNRKYKAGYLNDLIFAIQSIFSVWFYEPDKIERHLQFFNECITDMRKKELPFKLIYYIYNKAIKIKRGKK